MAHSEHNKVHFWLDKEKFRGPSSTDLFLQVTQTGGRAKSWYKLQFFSKKPSLTSEYWPNSVFMQLLSQNRTEYKGGQHLNFNNKNTDAFFLWHNWLSKILNGTSFLQSCTSLDNTFFSFLHVDSVQIVTLLLLLLLLLLLPPDHGRRILPGR